MSRATRRLNSLNKPSRPAPQRTAARAGGVGGGGSRPKPKSSGPRRPGGGRVGLKAGVLAALVTLAVVAAVVLVSAIAAYRMPGPAARQGKATTVILPKGAGVNAIAGQLRRAGVIRSDMVFVAAAQITGDAKRLRAGEYAFPSRSSVADVLARIRSGKIVHHRVTVPEGLTSQQVVDVLNRSPVLVGAVEVPPEGALLPETYEVVRGEKRTAVLQRMEDARDRLLIQLWEHRKPGLPYTNVAQAVTLASIVERETARPAERPRVAAVYLNRLRVGEKLFADPTVAYGVDKGKPLGRPLSKADLQTNTPYNTYLHPGLPPTPIGNPGRASLAAVLDPPTTSELYFVADGRGGHVFSSTLEEHNRNVARWRQVERERAAARPPAPRAGTPPAAAAPNQTAEHR